MRKLALALAATGSLALSMVATPAIAMIETPEAKAAAADAAAEAHADMVATFGVDQLRPGQYLWDDEVGASEGEGDPRVIVSLSNQMAYLYRGDRLVAATSVSSGKPGNDTPTGYFPILEKKPMHRSIKYDNAPMPQCRTCSVSTNMGSPFTPASIQVTPRRTVASACRPNSRRNFLL